MSAFSDAFKAATRAWASKGRLYVVNFVRDRKLSGQVLKRRTGTGARSISSESSSDEDSFTIGTSVVYMVGWEMGFTRPAYTVRPVNAKALKIPFAGGFIFRKSANIPAKAFGERSFIRTGISDSNPYLIDTGEKEVSKAIGDSFPDRTITVRRG